jgi:ribosomal protein uS17
MADVAMPRLSDSMEEGTILKWLKSDGDEVSRGDELVEIETDKANMTYEADQGGTLKIVAQEGDTLPVGQTIAQIGGGGNGAAASQEEEPQAEASEGGDEEQGEAETQTATAEREDEGGGNGRPSETPQEAPARAEAPDGGNCGRTKASPVARRMARELGLELAQLQGTGPGGRIVKADVEAAAKGDGAKAEAPAEEPAAEEPEEEAAAPAAPAPQSGPKPKRKRLPRALRPKKGRVTREKSSERKPITRIPKPESEFGRRQERQGTVVSDRGDKTIVVKVDTIKAHPRYKKVVRRSKKFHAHDEQNQAKIGDVVKIIETRPISKTKNWRLAEILEVAK